MIDPQIQGLMSAMAKAGFAMPDPLEATAMRALLDAPIPAPPIAVAERRDLDIALDDRTLAARLYHAAPGDRRPGVLFFHGGGWVHGTLDTHDRLCAQLANRADCAVLSVDYRLAPEHPFPAAWDDAVAAFDWLAQHGEGLGIDPQALAVAGDSAGGNLAAALAQYVAQAPTQRAPLRHQLLFYPVTDGRAETASFKADHAGFLSRDQMLWYWDQYAPGDTGLDPRASPGLAMIRSDLPSATIVLAGHDPLHDEGLAYAEALRQAGVSVALLDDASAIHGFASLIGLIPIADAAVAFAAQSLKAALTA